MNETSAIINTAAKASVPAVGGNQLGFSDLLGLQANPAIVEKHTKSGVRYCLLPATGKGKSMKSEFGLTGGQAKARAAAELHNFSTRAFAGVSGAIASGKMLVGSVVLKESGRMTVNLVPNNAVVVQAPVDLKAVEAYLKAHPDDAKLLLADVK